MRLGELAPDLAPGSTAEVTGVTADSRAVRPGMVFAALQGTRVDGAAFAAEACAMGAVAVLAAPEAAVEAPVVLRDADPRRRLALMAAALAGRQPRTVVAVTGTAGKTSVAHFVQQIFKSSGVHAVSVGTLGIRGAMERPGTLTTMDPVELHAALAGLAEAGIERVAMEASSHGLDQRRLDGVRLTAAGFTNIGRDHLDYHGTAEAYLAAKLRLFDTLLPEGAPAVVDPDARGAADVLRVSANPFTVGPNGRDLRVGDLCVEQAMTHFTLRGARKYNVSMPLVGSFQMSNALIAAGLAIAGGVREDDAVAALEALTGAPGRLERVAPHNGALVYVDYAHKPEAITAALGALRAAVPGQLVIVVGAGGDRDPGKRPLMGKAAADGADIVIITDDNPRSEDPAKIRAAVREGAPDATEIGDRREAIAQALTLVGEGDVVLVAGKGHEDGQTIGGRTLPFNDADVVRSLANGRWR